MAKKSVAPEVVVCKLFGSVNALKKLNSYKIANLLASEGIHGEVLSEHSCALARKFMKDSGAPDGSIGVGPASISVGIGNAPLVTIDLPENLEDFVSDFDDDKYPNLVTLDANRFEELTDDLRFDCWECKGNFKNKTVTLSGTAGEIAKAKDAVKKSVISKVRGIDIIYICKEDQKTSKKKTAKKTAR